HRSIHEPVFLRRSNDPAQLELDWDRKVVSELGRSAEYYKALLAQKPGVTTVLRLWLMQYDAFELLVEGTSDPDLYEQRKRDLDAAEARMAALLQQIIEHNEQLQAARRSAN